MNSDNSAFAELLLSEVGDSNENLFRESLAVYIQNIYFLKGYLIIFKVY